MRENVPVAVEVEAAGQGPTDLQCTGVPGVPGMGSGR